MATATTSYSPMAMQTNGSVFSETSMEDMNLCSVIRRWFYNARDARRPLAAQWKRNYRTLNNQPWTPGVEPWVNNKALPQMWPIVASMVSWMTDQRPQLEVMPAALPFSEYSDFYQKLSDDMNVALNSTFSVNLLDAEISKVLWDVHTYGIGYVKTQWEPWLADALGDVVFRRVDPFCIYPDPLARDWKSCEYVIEARNMTLSDVYRTYPGAANKRIEMMEDIDISTHKLSESTNPHIPRVAYSNFPTTTVSQYGIKVNPSSTAYLNESQLVTVLECWYREYESEPTQDPTMFEVHEVWCCAVICGNTVLMRYKADEINAHGGNPYDKMVLFDTGEWYGPTLVEMLAPCQFMINDILGQIKNNINLMGNPILVESPRSKSQNVRVTNRPGQRFTAQPDEVAWLNPPQMHPQLAVMLIQYLDGKMESISGMSAIVRGFQPSGRNSQGVLDTVQDAAFVRIRGTLRELERMLKGVCTKMVATIAEFYIEPRLLSLWGPDGQKSLSILRKSHFYTPDTKPVADDNSAPEDVPMRFLVIADAGSQLFTSKQARSADAERLYALGAIDVLELLKAKQWPNWGVVSKRVMEQQAMSGTLGQGPGARQRTRA